MSRPKNVCYVYDEPVSYKGLLIYPIQVLKAMEFYSYVDSLQVDKNSIPDPKIISMSYLDYIVSVSDETNYFYEKVIFLLKLCLRLEDIETISAPEAEKIYNSGKNIWLSALENPKKESDVMVINNSIEKEWKDVYGQIEKILGENIYFFSPGDIIQLVKQKGKTKIQIKEEFYSTSDFDKIKDIILEQNGIEKIDESIRKETRDKLDKAKDLLNKIHGTDICDFENQIICLSVATGFTLEEIYNMTIRKFKKYIARINHKLDYEIFKPAMLSGFITSKDKTFPKHWMANLESAGRYDDVLIDEEEVKTKVNNKK